jgi:hypothetical protein
MRRACTLLAICVMTGASVAPLQAQTGRGRTGAAVLQLPAGARAAAMGGAYVAGDDADALFYNPAAAAASKVVASVSWQQHVEDIGYGSAAAGIRLGPAAFGVTLGFLDYGSIAEVVPDPAFLDQRGTESGERVNAAEVVGRATLATSFFGGRLAVGASGGMIWVSLAETGRVTPVFDAGVQFGASSVLALGVALRNAGGPIDGARLAAEELPTELRGGARYVAAGLRPGFTATFHADVVALLHAGSVDHTGVALGVEALLPTSAGGPRAALRAGFDGARTSRDVGRLHLGAGLSFARFDVDYAFQSMGVLGAVHRFGLRWQR